ncbi:MAG: hypothetical protein BKP49_03155 [Treponema sp. CETP13]|nr:MAG: hypothetical protein BKP49_03155 [Treponema sp. CETP13]
MNINFQNSAVLFLLLLLIPVAVFVRFRIKKDIAFLFNFYNEINVARVGKLSISKRMMGRFICWALAWACVVIALAGPTWGEKPIEVIKSGTSVMFVFDISYSMLAEDVALDAELPQRLSRGAEVSRLEASKQFVVQLLKKIPETTVGGVLAKGDGVLGIPLTDDYYALENLVSVLSPNLVSAPGSSIAQGIETAISAFPPQSAHNSVIMVCTDGDETDNSLVQAVKKASSYGIQVVLIGFGSTNETSVIAGDGKTSVKTALRESRLLDVAEQTANCTYLSGSSSHVVSDVIDTLHYSAVSNVEGSTKVVTNLRMVPIERHGFFLLLAVVFVFLGVMFAEFQYTLPPKFAKTSKVEQHKKTSFTTKTFLLLICIIVPFLETGCSQSVKNAATILRGKYQWAHYDYDNATATFFSALEDAKERDDKTLEQYSLYGLATAYLMQQESEAALKKFQEIDTNASKEVLFNTWYDIGIIQFENNKTKLAAEAFKNALRIDSSSVKAKINYELAIKTVEEQSRLGKQELIEINNTESFSQKADSVFSVVQENEEKQWKNNQQVQDNSGVLDY